MEIKYTSFIAIRGITLAQFPVKFYNTKPGYCGAKGYMPLSLTADQKASLLAATNREPRSLLGYHEFARENDVPVAVVRVLERDAVSVSVFYEDESVDNAHALMMTDSAGLFEGRVPYRRPLPPYRLHIRYRDGAEAIKHDPYYFAPQLSDFDLYLFGEGNHHTIYRKLGAH
ncbi:MAG: hypothetical protein ABUL58_06140, partial [Steroidobacter sp.]